MTHSDSRQHEIFPPSEAFLLTTMAENSEMSLIAIDRDARITRIVGRIGHDVEPLEKNAVGMTIDQFFKNNPEHALRYHDALHDKSTKVVFESVLGGFYEVRVVPIRDDRQEIIGALGFGYDVTEREKAVRREVEETNRRTQVMFDATPLASSFWDRDGNMLDCNMEAVRLFGLADKAGYLEHFFDLNPEFQPDGESTAEKAKKLIAATFETGFQRLEWMYQTLDGQPLPVETTLVRVPWQDDYRLAAYSRDLRETKAKEREVHEANQRSRELEIQRRAFEEANQQMRPILDAMPFCCHVWDRNLKIIDCNHANLNMFGISGKDFFFERFDELSPKFQPNGRLSSELAREKIEEAFNNGRTVFEWTHQKPGGETIPAEITIVRVRRGEDDLAVAYLRDLRETKKNEAALELDRLRMNALYELTQMTNRPEQDVIDFTIETGVKLTGSSIGYIVMLDSGEDVLPFRSLVYGKIQDCLVSLKESDGTPHTLADSLTECLKTRQAVIHDDFAAMPGEKAFPKGHFEVRSHMNLPIFDGDHPIGLFGVGNKETPYSETDVKQLTLFAQGMGSQLSRRRYAENLELARNEAENANKAKSEFLAHMSHEIRTPLNGVIGLSELLIGTPLNEKQNEYAQLINASGKSLLFLINDILDFSKIEAGKLEIDTEPFDLPATVESVLGILTSRAAGKDLELAVSFCRYLPRIVQGDAGRIRQILLNLVGNAVKFTDHGGVRVAVSIDSVQEDGATVRFRVSDTGIGIPKDRIDRLFKAFSQADASSARVYGGTGLGLAISMKLVRLMGGEIGVESELGKGSTFWFTVPFGCESQVIRCLQDSSGECPAASDRSCPNIDGDYCVAFTNRGIDGKFDLKNRRVLVVDDNLVQRETLCEQLRNWKMDAVSCDTGKEALRLLNESRKQDRPFELIVIDNTLADGDGLGLANRLHGMEQNEEAETRMILLRSLTEEIDRTFLEESGAESIAKPVFASVFFDAVMNGLFAVETRETDGSNSDVVKPSRRRSRGLNVPSSENRLSSFEGKIHVLIVEDNRVNQIVAKNLLREAGFSCDLAINGNEACDAVRNRRYDVVLMDCQMPEMDGYEATRLIRDWERDRGKKRIPIIALTANATNDDVRKCLDCGMDAYCSKPINPQMMIRLIEEWFVKYSM